MPIADKTSGICQRSFAWTLHLFFKPPFSKSIYPTSFRRQIYHFVNTIPNKSNKMSHFIDKRLSFSIFKDLDSFFLDFKIREIRSAGKQRGAKSQTRIHTKRTVIARIRQRNYSFCVTLLKYYLLIEWETDRRARPLARRRASTLRPSAVDILKRKPCLFTLFLFEGWNVLFIFVSYFVIIQYFGLQK